jgi:hypothetical protein
VKRVLSDLTSPTAIKLAIEECDRLGREQFLSTHGFGFAREYVLRYGGKEYDSKAIVGVAHGIQHPDLDPFSTGFYGGIAKSGAATKAFELGFEVEGMTRPSSDWSLSQCEITVQAYFECFAKKLAGEPFNRAKTCRDIAKEIHRSAGAVDYKFQNIDAVLAKNGLSRMMNAVAANVQRLLTYVVLDPLAPHYAVFEIVPKHIAPVTRIEELVVAPPVIPPTDADDDEEKSQVARKVDFAKREANNRNLGRCGEEWVLSFERARLCEAGRSDLAELIDWVSDRRGDGLGYDIVSFEVSGEEIYIEVKATKGGVMTPFFISPNELDVSERRKDAFRLYRIFDYSMQPRMYILKGSLTGQLDLKAQAFAAMPNGKFI